MWKNYNYGATIGRKGSENGTILKDEEYNDLCRITLEKCSRYYAVTCGIYGELVHTAFADDGGTRFVKVVFCESTSENAMGLPHFARAAALL